MLLLVTGLPSPGKARFIDALNRRLGPNHMIVGTLPGAQDVAALHVHAETDVEALVEGASPTRDAARRAELVVRVDWEPISVTVDRVVETLRSRFEAGV